MIGLVNYTLIGQNPKPIMGYSDLTALLTAISQKTNLVDF
jgi:muramoyltetrapeptide carboxypeptidase LdcA involved in peptidoglycan recycling